MEGVELVGIVDVDLKRANQIASQFDTSGFSDFKALLDQVDAVSVVVPTPEHFEISRVLLENNVHIMIEKPITETLEQADTLVRLAEERNLVVQVGHLERFNPAVVALGGVITKPMFIESHRLAVFNERGTEVDVVLDLMIHDIDIILNMVRSEILSIDAVGVPVVTTQIDIANARLRFQSGCVANVTASRISIKNMRKIRIFQKDTYVSVDYAGNDITIIRRNGEGIPLPVPGMTLDRRSFEKADPLEAELEAFIASVRTGKEAAVTARDGRLALKVAKDIVDKIQAHTEEARIDSAAL
jgi:predicted dehydrogenase